MNAGVKPSDRPIAFRLAQRRAQARQGTRAGQRAEEQAVGPQHAPDQRQRAGQVVDLIEHSRADHQVETGVGEGQPVLVRLHPASRACPGEAGIRAHDPRTRRSLRRHRQRRIEAAEVQHRLERAANGGEPVEDAFDHHLPQEIVLAEACHRAVAPLSPRGAIEDRRRGAGGRGGNAHPHACALAPARRQAAR